MPALAGQFTVSPIRIYMNPEDRAVAVTITNESDEPLRLQADLYLWTQTPDGQEVLELTEDMFLSPPILFLEPRGRQVVRLARLTTAAPTEEMTFRLIAREILEDVTPESGVQIQVAMAMSLPIFITPYNARSELDCALERQENSPLKVVCENTGTAYAQPREVEITNIGGEALASMDVANYILPGIRVDYDIPEDAEVLPGNARLNVTLDDNSEVVFSVAIPE